MATYLTTATVGLFDYTKTIGATAFGSGGSRSSSTTSSTAPTRTRRRRPLKAATTDREDADRLVPVGLQRRAVPVRLHRRGRGPDLRRRLRARGPDQDPLPDQQRRRSTRSPTRSRTSGSATACRSKQLERHLAQRGLGDVVAVELVEPASTAATTPNAVVRFHLRVHAAAGRAGDTPPASPTAAGPVPTRSRSTRAGALMIEGLRQIIGDSRLPVADQDVADREPLRQRRHGAVHRHRPSVARQGGRLRRQRASTGSTRYFQQWLYGTGKPTLTPATFFATLDGRVRAAPCPRRSR